MASLKQNANINKLFGSSGVEKIMWGKTENTFKGPHTRMDKSESLAEVVCRQDVRLAEFRSSAIRQYILSASISCSSHLL